MAKRTEFVVATGCAAAVLAAVAMPARGALDRASTRPAAGLRPLVLAQLPAAPAPNVEANIANLHQRLQITPAQEPQFQALANVMRENARSMPPPPPTNPNAVEGLRLAIQFGQDYLSGMRRMLPPLQALYAVLSPPQRAIADQVFRQGPGE